MSTEGNNITPEQFAAEKAKMIQDLTDQLEVKRLREELQRLNASMVVHRFQELEALQRLSQLSAQPPQEDLVEHIVTQHDVDNIPEYKAQGLQVGQKIGIPSDVYAQLYPNSGKEQEAPKPGMSVV